MKKSFDFYAYFASVLSENAEAMRSFFLPDALIRWHNTNECFTVDEFIRVNCEYPDAWAGTIEHEFRIGEENSDLVIAACRVWSVTDPRESFHVVSFIRLRDGMIAGIDEYWGDDGEPPEWRRALGIGRPIV